MNFKKIFTYILLTAYLFISTGLNSYAVCQCKKINSQARVIKCACCMDKVEQLGVKDKAACKCFKNKQNANDDNIQSTSTSIYDLANLEYICKKISPISNFIAYNTNDDKINFAQSIILNKNLAMLRTVILLN